MKYCEFCGSSVANSANYCPNCGAPLNNEARKAGTLTSEPADLDVGYRVVLFSRGSCTVKTAREVLCDLLGYTTATANDLLDNMPIEVADELSELQAVTIAQALAEYGMEVTIVDEDDNYVDFSDRATESVFNSNGSLIASALAALATLSAANRVHRYRRYKRPSLLQLLFTPHYKVPKPFHVRRRVVHYPESPYRYEVRRPAPAPMRPPVGHKPAPAYRPPVNQKPANKPLFNQKPARQPSVSQKPVAKPATTQRPKPAMNQKPASRPRPAAASKPSFNQRSAGRTAGTGTAKRKITKR